MPTRSARNRNTCWLEGVLGVGSLSGMGWAWLSQLAGVPAPARPLREQRLLSLGDVDHARNGEPSVV